MRMRFDLWVLVSLWPMGVASGATPEWELVRTGLNETAFIDVEVHPTQPQRLFAASKRALYESVDSGRNWQERFRLPAQVTAAGVAMNAVQEPIVLLATDHGLYGSFDGDQHWSQIFRSAGAGEMRCTSVIFHPQRPDVALLGTQGGLFMSADSGRHWSEVNAPLDGRAVIQIAFDPHEPDRAYVLTDQTLFAMSLSTGQWQRRFSLLSAEAPEVEEPEEQETEEANGSFHHLSAMAVDPQNPSTLYLATARGLQMSTDEGITWQPMSQIGLESLTISRLLLQHHSPLVIYAATTRGVARYEPQQERWEPMVRGLTGTAVNDLVSSEHDLWAATEEGLYRFAIGPSEFGESEPPSPQELLSNFVNEPTIAQVQTAAIRYAEVHPDKIRKWRQHAALKALLPSVDLGWDRKRSMDTSIDEGTFPKFQLIETEDRNAGLDLSVTWRLGDLIWNSDQTSIDVRSKLMVQLRDDIINEVTRTYFERRRLQVALLTQPPTEQQALLEKELRLQELTALIDGLTGGYLSQQMKVDRNQ